MEEKVYLFQDWSFYSNTIEKFKEWDKQGKILEKLRQQEVYTHTDSQWGFLIISLHKDKLLEIAEKRKQEEIQDCEFKLKQLKGIRFE